MMQFNVITLFPEMFGDPFKASILNRAQEKGLIKIELHNLRDYCEDKHRVTDDLPYGGGVGMIMKAEPLITAIEAIRSSQPEVRTLLMTPQGKRFEQSDAVRLARYSSLTLVCGRYEGVDERVRGFVDEEISIGDYILTGGELASMVVTDAIARLIPGVLGDATSLEDESFSQPLLESPHYTRPRVFRGMEVPEILLSGNHTEIERWRRQQALKRTKERRPDLLSKAPLSKEDMKFLEELKN
ncbi:MAG: tRNA (guanine-N1)-methyltransferase [Deltaproteobacteria bacterium DG_8]|nr:MAG: tRNA (guanine-N1)-methyltransferase [Deltaproteobacteria bacterium DG_8]